MNFNSFCIKINRNNPPIHPNRSVAPLRTHSLGSFFFMFANQRAASAYATCLEYL